MGLMGFKLGCGEDRSWPHRGEFVCWAVLKDEKRKTEG